MEESLREICREARERKHITAQDLSDETGIPFSTINNYFASASRAPSVYNAGLICAVLGVSLDKYFGIEPEITPEERLRQFEESRDADIRAARLEGNLEQLSAALVEHKKQMRRMRKLLYIMSALFTIVLLVSTGYIFLDFKLPHVGIIRGGEMGIFGIVVLILLCCSVAMILASIISAAKYRRQFERDLWGAYYE